MPIARRPVLFGALAAAIAGPRALIAAETARRFVAGGMNGDKCFLAELKDDETPRELRSFTGRAHQVTAMRNGREVIAMARGDDRWAWVVNPDAPERAVKIEPTAGHSFSGHVALSPDGATAAFVEIRSAGGEGFLSLREVGTWRETGRTGTGGIGPHMLLWVDARRIAVGNGGYRDLGVFSPNGRLNSSLAIVDPIARRVDTVVGTDDTYGDYSLRHLAAVPDGLLVALQRESKSKAEMPSIALWRGNRLEPAGAPGGGDDPLRFYCSDVVMTGDVIFGSSLRGGAVGAWRRSDLTWLGAVPLPGAGALALDESGTCYCASADGDIVRLACNPTPVITWRRKATFGWDQHGTFL